jgi:predicted unusual protein kinase regulating ubiquinone biosynthesis (AarF/ABC1/UbiB family)
MLQCLTSTFSALLIWLNDMKRAESLSATPVVSQPNAAETTLPSTAITVEMVGWEEEDDAADEPEPHRSKSFGQPEKSGQVGEISAEAPSLASEVDSRTYSPDAIRIAHQGQYWRVFRRWLTILFPVLDFAFRRWLDQKTGQEKANEHLRAVQLRELLTDLGPAYIKIGQALSTRPDLVPPLYLEELTKLQDQLPPFSNEIAYQFIEEELGSPPSELYAELSEQPIAAASLGQVYKGKLKTGEVVAVKVQRPGLAESITLDIYILRSLATLVQKSFKGIRSDLPGILDEFAGRLFEEMDYTQEGQNAERFASLYCTLPDVYVPKIYWPYTNRRVLTMEWITGTKLNQPEVIQAQGVDASYLIDVGIQCSLRQLLEHGFFHADPHPGNLLAMPNGKLAYLDFGMMSEIRPDQRYGLINALVHIVNREFDGLANDYVHLGFLGPEVDLTPIIPALATVFNNAMGASVAELNIQRIFEQLSEIMYDYPFQVPAYYALIVRSLLTMEGIAMGVDPNFKVLSAAYPYVAKRLLTDPAPALRSSLRDLLFKDGSFRWNRLENLLRNARDNRDYDLNTALNQGIEFLFSERGEFIRDRITEEVVKAIDSLGRGAIEQVSQSLLGWLGWRPEIALVKAPTPNSPTHTNSHPNSTFGSVHPGHEQNSLEHFRRIFSILQDTPGYDPMRLLPVLMQLLVRSETHQMGRQIALGIVQRNVARLIREFLITDPSPARSGYSLSLTKGVAGPQSGQTALLR